MIAMAIALAMSQAGSDVEAKVRIDKDQALQWSNGPWRVFPYPDEGTCDLGYSAPNGEYITLAYSARNKSVRLLMTNRNATSVDAGDTVTLNVVFLRNGKMSAHWEQTEFETHVAQGDKRAFVSEGLAVNFLDAFANADYMVAMTTANVGVGGAKLEGSAEAVNQLRDCGFETAGLNPNDPFLK